MAIEHPKKTLKFDPDKASTLLEELLSVFQKHKPTIGEILAVTSNLIYSLGASIGEFDEKGPGIEELNRIYYSEPGRLDVAMMLQGLTMSTWFSDWEKLQTQQDKEQDNEPNAICNIQGHRG